MAVLKANGSFLKANGKILVRPEGVVDFVVIGGRAYPFVQIGRQLWITENLDWKKSGISIGGGQTSNPTAWYYNNDEATFGYNGNKFGLLYNYAAAEIIKDGLTNGWRISSEDDCNRLKKYVADDGNKLKSIQYWNTPGNNDTGFNMYPSGHRGSSFDEYGIYGYLRTDTIYSGTQVSFAYVADNGTIYVGPYSSGNVGLPIRVCKDATVNIGGRDYPTTKIGNQIWLAQNLDYAWSGLPISGGYDNSAAASYYDNDEQTNGWNGRKCGLLYNHNAVLELNNTILPQILPGWRVPSDNDFNTLKNSINDNANDAYKLSESGLNWASNWTGNNQYGFSAIPSGQRYEGANDYHDMGGGFVFFSIEKKAWIRDNNSLTFANISSNPRYSIRLVKDA